MNDDCHGQAVGDKIPFYLDIANLSPWYILGVNKFFIFNLYSPTNLIDQSLNLWGLPLPSLKSTNLIVDRKRIYAKYENIYIYIYIYINL